MTILIDTSGWSSDDWTGPFYPREIENKKGEWLANSLPKVWYINLF